MKFLITAGPTREAIDPVRFLSNRSSGRMGFAVAEAAARGGHEVVLIAGPVTAVLAEDLSRGSVQRIDVESADEMFEAVAEEIGGVDVAIMAAAVADYRPVAVSDEKIKKSGERLVIDLEPTRDILGSARAGMDFDGVLVGFAAETENLEEHATSKLERKGCDLVVANDVGRKDIGFDVAENELLLLFADGREEALPKGSKSDLGRELVSRIEALALNKAAPSET